MLLLLNFQIINSKCDKGSVAAPIFFVLRIDSKIAQYTSSSKSQHNNAKHVLKALNVSH
jgi:hypothetical protein